MAGAMSEIIHYVDSEITAGTAVVKKSAATLHTRRRQQPWTVR